MYNVSTQDGFAAAVSFGTLIACSSEETVSTAGSNFEPPDEADLHLRAVSSKPWLVTGGDVLVELELAEPMAGSTVTLEINGVDVSEKLVSISPQVSQALLTGLPEGDNLLLATAGQQQRQLRLTNYPLSGPIISGPHEVPFYCQTSEFKKVNGEMFGAGSESGCEGPVQTDYVYYSTEQQAFLPYTLTFGLLPPVDMAELVIGDGESRPFIVRVETGVVNRAIYEIAMLHDPVDPDPDPWTRSAGWNGKLVYTHGGGCRSGWFQQGTVTVASFAKVLERGYALASSTLNVFGQNCNDLLASETHIMVKERFIERFGEPCTRSLPGCPVGLISLIRRQTIIRAYLTALLWAEFPGCHLVNDFYPVRCPPASSLLHTDGAGEFYRSAAAGCRRIRSLGFHSQPCPRCCAS